MDNNLNLEGADHNDVWPATETPAMEELHVAEEAASRCRLNVCLCIQSNVVGLQDTVTFNTLDHRIRCRYQL